MTVTIFTAITPQGVPGGVHPGLRRPQARQCPCSPRMTQPPPRQMASVAIERAAWPLARDGAVIRGEHQILAPVPLRSQVLSLLYQAVRRGELRGRMPSDSSAARAGYGSGCWKTLSFTTLALVT